MPNITTTVSQDIDIDINIDVWCGTCGAWLCNDTRVDDRKMSFTVDVCSDCMSRKDEEIQSLKEEIESLEKEIDEIQNNQN